MASKRDKKLVIRVAREDRRPKPRSGVKQSKAFKDKTKYSRHSKHPKRET